jgi:hypothetical protein
VTDPAKARAAFGKLIGLLQSRGGVAARPTKVDGAETAFALAAPGSPRPAVAARSEDRVVVASSAGAAADAFAPDDRLADSDTYAQAKSVLGDGVEPSMLVSMPAVLELASSSAGGDAHFEGAKPYLEAFSVLAGGSSRDGGRVRSRFAGGLR